MHRSISTALIAAAAIGVLAMLVVFVRDYGRLPEIVPTHFGVTGTANAWGPKSTFVIFPIIAIAMFGVVIAISTFGVRSRRGPVPPALPALACLLFAESIWMLTFAEMGSFAVALGQSATLGWGFFIGLGVEMATAFAIVIAAITASLQRRT